MITTTLHTANTAPHAATSDEMTDALVLDVRRVAAFEQATDLIPGATWRDPALVNDWAQSLSPNQTVIVYCVAGHEVSQGTAMALCAAGHSARFLVGGIEGWKASGRATSPKPPL